MESNFLTIHKNKLDGIQQKLGYYFNNLELLVEALCHPSLKQFSKNKIYAIYERLEFLGDSVLNLIISDNLFHMLSNSPEGELAKIRAFLVKKESICSVANSINLPDYIIMTTNEEASGGRSNLNNIEDSMEAVIGAIYVDSNFLISKAIVSSLWSELINNYANYRNSDPKSKLQEWAQSQGLGIPKYNIIAQHGTAHNPEFIVSVVIDSLPSQYGSGKTIKTAQKEAAKNMLLNVLN